jgi:hypothetical protein
MQTRRRMAADAEGNRHVDFQTCTLQKRKGGQSPKFRPTGAEYEKEQAMQPADFDQLRSIMRSILREEIESSEARTVTLITSVKESLEREIQTLRGDMDHRFDDLAARFDDQTNRLDRHGALLARLSRLEQRQH